MQSYSTAEQNRIRALMTNGRLFSVVKDIRRKDRIMQGLRHVSERILALYMLSEDLIYLELPIRSLRDLFPKSFRGKYLKKDAKDTMAWAANGAYRHPPIASKRCLLTILHLAVKCSNLWFTCHMFNCASALYVNLWFH